MEKEQQKELSKILGISKGMRDETTATWAEIYREIGALQERSIQNNKFPCQLKHFPSDDNPLAKPLYDVNCGGTQSTK